MASMGGNSALSAIISGTPGFPGVQQTSPLGWPCSRVSSGAVIKRWQNVSKPLGLVWAPCSIASRKSRLWRERIQAAQEAAQAEAAEDEKEEEEELSDDDSGEVESRVPVSTLEPLLKELKAAIVAKDEQYVLELESQLGAMDNERAALGKQVLNLIEEVQTGKERVLRLSADFENYRKRSENEKSNLAFSVKGDVIETLLPMVDNFERAKSSIRPGTEGEEKIDRSYQGIYKQFVEIMKGLGVVAVETVGKAFDPNLHEAIMREESTEFEEGIVVQEFRRGFSIGSKLVRPAMVKVSSGPPTSKEQPAQAETVEELQELASTDTQ